MTAVVPRTGDLVSRADKHLVGTARRPAMRGGCFTNPRRAAVRGGVVGLPVGPGPRAGIRSHRGVRGHGIRGRLVCVPIPVIPGSVTVRVARASISCESRRSVSIRPDTPPGLFVGSDRPGGCT